MIPKNLIKPLELVVSAIHCLKEEKGSSPQTILRYLMGKYNVNTEILRPHVQAGLKRGLSFGLITSDCGLYRLNDILSSPSDQTKLGSGDNIKVKAKKKIKRSRKPRRLKKLPRSKRRPLIKRCHRLRRSRRKPKLIKTKKRKTKHIFVGEGARRNEIKWKRQRRQKSKDKTDESVRAEKVKTEPVKIDLPTQRPTVSTKEQEKDRLIKAQIF